MNKAVSFPNSGQIRSTTAAGTKTSNQLVEGFSNDCILVIHQVTGTRYNGERESLLIDWSLWPPKLLHEAKSLLDAPTKVLVFVDGGGSQ